MSHHTEREDADRDEHDDHDDHDDAGNEGRRGRAEIDRIRDDAAEAIKPNKREPAPDAAGDGEESGA